jgi:hypothetical protein
MVTRVTGNAWNEEAFAGRDGCLPGERQRACRQAQSRGGIRKVEDTFASRVFLTSAWVRTPPHCLERGMKECIRLPLRFYLFFCS